MIKRCVYIYSIPIPNNNYYRGGAQKRWCDKRPYNDFTTIAKSNSLVQWRNTPVSMSGAGERDNFIQQQL